MQLELKLNRLSTIIKTVKILINIIYKFVTVLIVGVVTELLPENTISRIFIKEASPL